MSEFTGYQVPRAPLHRSERYPLTSELYYLPRVPSAGVTPPSSLILAHAPVLIPPSASVCPRTAGLGRLLSAPAGSRTFPALSLRIFLCVLEPLPRLPPWCFPVHLFPRSFGLPGVRTRSAPAFFPYGNFCTEFLTRLQLFVYLQARRFARPPGCSYRSAFT